MCFTGAAAYFGTPLIMGTSTSIIVYYIGTQCLEPGEVVLGEQWAYIIGAPFIATPPNCSSSFNNLRVCLFTCTFIKRLPKSFVTMGIGP